MTNRLIGDIVITVKTKGTDKSGRETIMATVNFAANGFATAPVVYYLHSEHYEALFSKEKHGFHVPLILNEVGGIFYAPLAQLGGAQGIKDIPDF